MGEGGKETCIVSGCVAMPKHWPDCHLLRDVVEGVAIGLAIHEAVEHHELQRPVRGGRGAAVRAVPALLGRMDVHPVLVCAGGNVCLCEREFECRCACLRESSSAGVRVLDGGM